MSPFQSATESNIAAEILIAARRMKISQAALAKEAGTSRETMNAYLNGRTPMPVSVLLAICEVIDIPLHTLARRAAGTDE